MLQAIERRRAAAGATISTSPSVTPTDDELRHLAVRFQSESLLSPQREQRLLSGPLHAFPDPGGMFRAQVRPTQWWSPLIADKLGLPEDGVVWHYHPGAFVAFPAELLDRRPQAAARAQDGAGGVATDGMAGDSGYLD